MTGKDRDQGLPVQRVEVAPGARAGRPQQRRLVRVAPVGDDRGQSAWTPVRVPTSWASARTSLRQSTTVLNTSKTSAREEDRASRAADAGA